MKYDDISRLTYPQIYLLHQCIRECGKASRKEAAKAQAFQKVRIFKGLK